VAPVNRKELSTEEGIVLDGAVLNQLYMQRDRAEKKKEATQEARAQKMSQPVSQQNKGQAPQQRKVSVHFEVPDGSTIGEVSSDESELEMEDWGSDLEASMEPDSLFESIVMVDTPVPTRRQAPPLPQTPVRPRHVSPMTVGKSVGSPMRRITRSRSARS